MDDKKEKLQSAAHFLFLKNGYKKTNIAQIAKKNGYSELMPYFCETDKAVMEHFGGTLYREHTVAEGYEDCYYWIKNKVE